MAKTLLGFGFVLNPYILQNRFFNSLERDPEWKKKNVRVPSALLANFLEVENLSFLASVG